MKTWNEFIEESIGNTLPQEWEGVDVECPECGSRICINTMRILTSNPPKRLYKCFNCDWVGYH